MPIGAQSKSKKPAIATPPASSATQFVAPRQKSIHQAAVVVPDFNNNNDKPPSYDEANEEAQIPTKLVTPTSEHDLQYFAAVSSGGTPEISASNSKLVLHLFRTTQTHIFPIEERLALGASSSNPFYALRSALGSTSVDEYNKLTLTRRWPRTDVWQTVVVSEIAPRLKLLATGQMLISRLRIEGRQARVQDIFELWWDSQTGSYHVWRNKEIPELEICCEGWGSLDEVPRTGALVAKDRSETRNETNDILAIIDFNTATPQFICLSHFGHMKLDVIVASMLTAATVHTRRSKMMSQALAPHGLASMGSNNTILVHQQLSAKVRVVI